MLNKILNSLKLHLNNFIAKSSPTNISLFTSLYTGDLASLGRLIDTATKANTYFANGDGNLLVSAFSVAVSHADSAKREQMLKLLIERGADVNATSFYAADRYDVAEAIKNHKEFILSSEQSSKEGNNITSLDMEAVQDLINKNIGSYSQYSNLLLAIKNNDIDLTNLLLSQDKINLNAPLEHHLSSGIDTQQTALFVALTEGSSPQLLANLLKHGANPNTACNIITMLWYNKPSQLIESVKMTPITFAALQGNAETVDVLLEHCADPNIPDHLGMTTLYHAVQLLILKSEDKEDIAPYKQIVEALMAHGATLGNLDFDMNFTYQYMQDKEQNARQYHYQYDDKSENNKYKTDKQNTIIDINSSDDKKDIPIDTKHIYKDNWLQVDISANYSDHYADKDSNYNKDIFI